MGGKEGKKKKKKKNPSTPVFKTLPEKLMGGKKKRAAWLTKERGVY